MKPLSLLLLRVSLGLLMLLWGLKLVNVEHGLLYFGLFGSTTPLKAFGVVQSALGVLVIAGFLRRFTYPALLAITAVTLLGVWRSVVDPWGWYLEGSNVLFFPSLIIFAGALVLHAFRDEDVLSLDRRLPGRATGARPATGTRVPT